jgi:hypothetical protein
MLETREVKMASRVVSWPLTLGITLLQKRRVQVETSKLHLATVLGRSVDASGGSDRESSGPGETWGAGAVHDDCD